MIIKISSSENNSMGNLSAELATCSCIFVV